MDKIEIRDKVVDILSRHTSVDRCTLSPEKSLKLDLGLDSLDVAEKISDTVDFVHESLNEPPRERLPAQEH